MFVLQNGINLWPSPDFEALQGTAAKPGEKLTKKPRHHQGGDENSLCTHTHTCTKRQCKQRTEILPYGFKILEVNQLYMQEGVEAEYELGMSPWAVIDFQWLSSMSEDPAHV